MSEITRKEILPRCATAGLEYKTKLIDGAVELFGCHRKAAVRVLGHRAGIQTKRRQQNRQGL